MWWRQYESTMRLSRYLFDHQQQSRFERGQKLIKDLGGGVHCPPAGPWTEPQVQNSRVEPSDKIEHVLFIWLQLYRLKFAVLRIYRALAAFRQRHIFRIQSPKSRQLPWSGCSGVGASPPHPARLRHCQSSPPEHWSNNSFEFLTAFNAEVKNSYASSLYLMLFWNVNAFTIGVVSNREDERSKKRDQHSLQYM